jgi:biopolymer transport protein ExbB
MRRCKSTDRAIIRVSASGLVVLLAVSFAAGEDDPNRVQRALDRAGHDAHREAMIAEAGGPHARDDFELLTARVRRLGESLRTWYGRTPPADRVTWGGMAACASLGVMVLLERLVRLRRRGIMPAAFTARFLDRLHDGKLDCGQALDHCELNPSPAARVALAAVRRWGRPAADLERAVALAQRVETERLRRNVGTLRRIAVLTALLGLLGTLFALGRALEGAPVGTAPGAGPGMSAAPIGPVFSWGPAVAAALTPLSTGIIIATMALVAYDGLLIRVEKLAGELDRLGAETIDAIALAAPTSSPTFVLAPAAQRSSVSKLEVRPGSSVSPARTPHYSYFRQDEGTDVVGRSSPPESGF